MSSDTKAKGELLAILIKGR